MRGTSISRRLHRSFSIVILLLVGTGLIGIFAAFTINRRMVELIERDAPGIAANAAILQALTDAETGERGFLLTGDEAFLGSYASGRHELGGHLADARRLAGSDTAIRTALDVEERLAKEWLEDFAEPVIEIRREDAAAAAAMARSGAGLERFNRFREANATSAELLIDRQESKRAGAVRLAHRTVGGVAALVLLGCLIAVVVTTRTTAAVTGPLRSLRETLLALAGGDLAVRATVTGPEEIRAVALSVNQLAAVNEGLVAQRAHVDAAQLTALARERDAVERLRELDSTRQHMVASVSHELRTPLTSIIGYLELLVDDETGPLSPDQRRLTEILERNADRLLSLIESILALSSLESGSFKLALTPTDPMRLLAAARETMLPAACARGLSLECEFADDLPLVRADEGQLERVLLNLVSNAIKFTPPGGSVSLAASQRGDDLELRVQDTGMGIPVAEQERIFSPFFRSTTARRQAIQGTGLGLAIVQAIVERHGGSITVASAEGAGTSVCVTLPVGRPAVAVASFSVQPAGTVAS